MKTLFVPRKGDGQSRLAFPVLEELNRSFYCEFIVEWLGANLVGLELSFDVSG